jgi:tetratricopeptide (TPR) repeat protein
MFTVVLFAAFLTILWEYSQGGRVKLWLLPLLMLAWVNLHPGFISGLALSAAYIAIELLQMLQKPARLEASRRLRAAIPWLAVTLFATLLNPWGWRQYLAVFRQEEVLALHTQSITEWANIPLTSRAFIHSLSVRSPVGAIYLLLIVAIVATAAALARRQTDKAILLAGAAWFGVRHLRFEALFACVVLVAAEPILTAMTTTLLDRFFHDKKVRSILATGFAVLVVLLAAARSLDLVTNRYYFSTSGERRSFGTRLSWWFPQDGAEFIQREKLPAMVFNSYNEGGFVVWKLGPAYQDFIDGRAIPFGRGLFAKEAELMRADPDGPEWRHAVEIDHIYTILIPLGRYDGLEFFPSLPQFCTSQTWAPVYLDETSAVFLRRAPETKAIIERIKLNCADAPLPKSVSSNNSVAFNQWANAAAVLYTLGRSQEALAAADNSLNIFPDSSASHLIRARLLVQMGRTSEAENEFLAAADLEDNPAVWLSLARMYRMQGRLPAAIDALERAIELSPKPFFALLMLGNVYLDSHAPKDALKALERARKTLPSDHPELAVSNAALAELAQSRALAQRDLGDLTAAISEQQRAVQLDPHQSRRWLLLADLYDRQGRTVEAERARVQALSAEKP